MKRAIWLSFALCACGNAVHDAVPESHDTKTHPSAGGDGYVYIAKRPPATVGLAEARGLSNEEGKRATDRLADAMSQCLKDEARRGKLVAGAGRVVADIDSGGIVGAPRVTLSPGAQANGLLCMVAPFRMAQFSLADADAGARGIAIEATWDGQ